MNQNITGQLNLLNNANEEYKQFVDKFEVKKTTDDCYTPEPIYEIVADYVIQRYGVQRDLFVRPFWPGQNCFEYEYPDNCVVVDNPPFSLLTHIIEFYDKKKVRYFMFCPALVIPARKSMYRTTIVTSADIKYENGAVVKTNFCTNMEPETELRTDAALRKLLVEEQKQKDKKILPRYVYPDNIMTVAKAQRIVERGIDISLSRNECFSIEGMDEQKNINKKIFGGGYLMGSKAAAAAAAAADDVIEWRLSENEKEIIRRLDKNCV